MVSKTCQIRGCSKHANRIIRVGDDLVFLCHEHYDFMEKGIREINERVKNMTTEEMEARLKELEKEKDEPTH